MLASLLVLSVSVAQIAAAAPSPQAKAAFDRGEKALGANDLTGAEAAYKDAIAATPGYAEAINGLGSVYFKQGKRDEAINQFKAAIAADQKFALGYFNLGYATRRTKDYATAAQAYETYVKLKPDDPDGFYGLADSYRGQGENQKAIAAFEQYIAREKRPSERTYVEKAKRSVEELRAQPEAPAVAAPPPAMPPATAETPPTTPAPTITQPSPAPAPTVSPQAELAKRKLAEGDQFMAQKKYREASFSYQDAANADPTSIEALFKLGNTYAVLGYYTQAIERWKRVEAGSPDPSVKKSAQDNIAKAQTKLASAGGGTPQSQGKPVGSGPVAPATRQQARSAYEAGVRAITSRDYNAAVRSLTQAIQYEPSLAVAYVARGSAFIGLRRFAEAAADYQYANRLEPALSSPLYGMAEAYRAMGRTADARTYYEKYASSTASDVRPELQAQARDKAATLR